ncbi:MAG TPA: glycoside hydrolase domain-containing protein [Planctomycetota bacterium]|nr:glycoside hydrolase domain-containing protein [Planctomycetota bacterium]
MRFLKKGLIALLTALLVLSADLPAQQKPPAGNETVILDTSGAWRLHYTWKPPVVKTAGGIQPGEQKTGIWMNRETPGPPDGWLSPDFDDSGWVRLPGMPFPPIFPDYAKFEDVNFGFSRNDGSSPYLAHLAMRGKFEVTDPSKVKGLTLSLGYRGGVVVYVNGKEAARGHMPAGTVRPDTLAEDYPAEAFSMPDGSRLDTATQPKGSRDRALLHNRSLTGVRIPASLLRRGVNVLAISVHRAPYHEDVLKHQGSTGTFTLTWSTCGLWAARLTVPDADPANGPGGLVPNVVRPKGLQVWNSNLMAVDYDLDWGDPCEKLEPIRIVGTRNGAFSGKVVLGSDQPIQGLTATMSPLRSKDGAVLPASAVQVRCALPDRNDWIRGSHVCGPSARYPARVIAFDGLAETAPVEVPVRTSRSTRGTWVAPGRPEFVFGAVQPVWVTVEVPADARPGDYTGTLSLAAGGRNFSVPVDLRVCAWKLPDPKNWTTFTELIQSPESLALCYDVPLWSDEHFRKMEKSFKLMGQLGSRSLYLPLICQTNMGNAESMVRWIRTGENTYRYDLKPLERYLEIAEKHIGKPRVVCLYAWDIFLEGSHNTFGAGLGEPVPVTLLDPATGKTEEIPLPSYTTPEGKALWTPLLKEVRELLRKHGLDREVMLGLMFDFTPSKETLAAFAEMAPGLPWVIHCHGTGEANIRGAPIGYKAHVWAVRFPKDPGEGRTYGWQAKPLFAQFPRGRWNQRHLTNYRLLGEMNIAAQQNGFGRLGADFFPALQDKRGNRFSITGRFPKSTRPYGNLDIWSCLLKPGPDGALSSHGFEMMREGVQECEARIFIERAILDKKIDGELAERCQEVLDERTRSMLRGYSTLVISDAASAKSPGANSFYQAGYAGSIWYPGSGWEERLEKLYSAAAELAAKLDGN